MNLDASDIARFWAKVAVGSKSECWLWTAAKHPYGGYGKLGLHGKTLIASRVAYAIAHGEVPEGDFVCHTCDNPACCNPSHLWLGSAKENAIDAAKKGRLSSGVRHSVTQRGDGNGRSVLSEAIVREIRASNLPSRILAARYGVGITTLNSARSGRTWGHLEVPSSPATWGRKGFRWVAAQNETPHYEVSDG